MGVLYLTEGGQETEIMYMFGHDLPELSVYPLLGNAAAMADLKSMYERMLDVAAATGFALMLSGLDYRASPDWGAKLDYSREALADALLASIGFLQDVARPIKGRAPKFTSAGSPARAADMRNEN